MKHTQIYEKKYLTILPTEGSTLFEQINNCFNQIKKLVESSNQDFKRVLKQTIFVQAINNNDFYDKKDKIIVEMEKFYKQSLPPTSIIGQIPENNKQIAIELMIIIPKSDKIHIKHKVFSRIRYAVVEYSHLKEIYASGITSDNKNKDVLNQTRNCFELMKQILDKEGLTFSDVVRQWNYIENILSTISSQKSLKQNYQIFNDVRSLYYDSTIFQNGYPAATGIGMNTGGIVLEFVAVKPSKNIYTVSLKNPQQIDAHKYDSEVLVGEPLKEAPKKTTPKFERGKLLVTNYFAQIFISGTASILGQKTMHEGNVEAQTYTTIDNIKQLISGESLKDKNIELNLGLNSFSYIRVYVKNSIDIPKVKKICKNSFINVPALYVVSDVCREELLVEIEGMIIIE